MRHYSLVFHIHDFLQATLGKRWRRIARCPITYLQLSSSLSTAWDILEYSPPKKISKIFVFLFMTWSFKTKLKHCYNGIFSRVIIGWRLLKYEEEIFSDWNLFWLDQLYFFVTFFVLIAYLYIINKYKFIYLYFNIHTVCFI